MSNKLQQIENTLLLLESAIETMPIDRNTEYSKIALRSASFILYSVVLNRIVTLGLEEGMDYEDNDEMLDSFADEFFKLIKTYTDIEVQKL